MSFLRTQQLIVSASHKLILATQLLNWTLSLLSIIEWGFWHLFVITLSLFLTRQKTKDSLRIESRTSVMFNIHYLYHRHKCELESIGISGVLNWITCCECFVIRGLFSVIARKFKIYPPPRNQWQIILRPREARPDPRCGPMSRADQRDSDRGPCVSLSPPISQSQSLRSCETWNC